MRKTKPTRKIAVGGSRGPRTIHWGTYRIVAAKVTDPVRVRIMHGLHDWHPACTEKYAVSAREVPTDKPYKVTCKKCIGLWGEQ